MSGDNIPTLDDVREFLRMPDTYTQDDDMLSGTFLPAAIDEVRIRCGDVVAATYEEYQSGGSCSIWLYHSPVLSVQFAEENHGAINYTLTEQADDSFPAEAVYAFSIDHSNTGQVTRRTVGNAPVPFFTGENNLHFIYTAGRTECPAKLRIAILALTQYWYRSWVQIRADSIAADPTAAIDIDFERNSGTESISLGVPYQILEMMHGYRKMPIIG